MYDDVVNRLLSLGYTIMGTAEETAAIQYAIDRSEQWIKNNINQLEVPDGLRFIWVDMAAGLFLQTNMAIAGDAPSFVQSIKEGDTTVAFGKDGTTPAQKMDALLYSMVNPPQEQLAAYRRVKW